jgi:hypothetical protein
VARSPAITRNGFTNDKHAQSGTKNGVAAIRRQAIRVHHGSDGRATVLGVPSNPQGRERGGESRQEIVIMKKLFVIALLLCGLKSFALDYTYSTNLFYAIDTVTNVYIGTNAPDATRDSAQTAWNKVNGNDNYLLRKQVDLNLRFTNFVATNVVSSGSGGSASLWNWSVAGMYPNGTTGTGGGWTTTNLFIYPQ